MLEKLIGYQILEINNKHIIIKKDEKIITIEIIQDEGDCCGYNDISTELLYISNSKSNPVITFVELLQDEHTKDEDNAIITFFGEYAPIAKIQSCSSSGSGWCYGASVSLKCKILDIDETLTSW